jgi:hypothetical protein
MATRRKPTKTLRPKPLPKKVRIHVTPQLTRGEIKRLQARAAGDMRSVASYVAVLVIEDLRKRGGSGRRRGPAPSDADNRISYELAVPLTPDQKAQLQARARDQVRSASSYVGKLIVEELGRG